MTIRKQQHSTTKLQLKNRYVPIHTKISFLLVCLGTGIMLYIWVRYWETETLWAKSALMQFMFGISGLVGTQILSHQPLIPQNHQYKQVEIDTGIRACIIVIVSMFTQLISQQALSFSVEEQVLYYVFAAVTEEVFFRGFLLTIFITSDRSKGNFTPRKMLGCLIQAVAFTAIHQNYYADPAMLLSVFLGGFLLGLLYLHWRDLTANILGHFILNLIAVQNILVLL